MLFEFDRTLMNLFEFSKRQILAQPLNLGGISAPSGGAGGPPAGYIGQLPQYRSSFDETEAEIWNIPDSSVVLISGGRSLLTNLNRIRYRLNDIEVGISGILVSGIGGGELSIQEEDIDVGNATVLNFEGGVSVVDEGAGKITVTISGLINEETKHIYNEDLIIQLPTVSGSTLTTDLYYIVNTLRVYYNGLRQSPRYYQEIPGTDTFTVLFDIESGDELVVDYNYFDSTQPGWGTLEWGDSWGA